MIDNVDSIHSQKAIIPTNMSQNNYLFVYTACPTF